VFAPDTREKEAKKKGSEETRQVPNCLSREKKKKRVRRLVRHNYRRRRKTGGRITKVHETAAANGAVKKN